MVTALVGISIAIFDQLTKWAASSYLSGLPGQTDPVIEGFFSLRLVHNRGAAFGIFPRQNLLFIALSLVTIILLLVYYKKFFSRILPSRISAGLILGGAAGNLLDRIFRGPGLFRGHVVDFLDFQFGDYHWPAFNLADSAICVGVGILVFVTVFSGKSVSGGRSAKSGSPGSGEV